MAGHLWLQEKYWKLYLCTPNKVYNGKLFSKKFDTSSSVHKYFKEGYFGESVLEIVMLRGHTLHVVSRGEEIKNKERDLKFKAYKAAYLWMNRFRKLLVGFKKSDFSYLGLIKFACAFIAFREIQVI